MLGRLALVVLTVAADWGPPEPKKRSVRQHDAIDPDMAKKVVEGKGCWWEGDDWEGMLTCACTCGSCDQSWLDRCCDWNADTLKAPLWPMRCCPCAKESIYVFKNDKIAPGSPWLTGSETPPGYPW